MGDFLITRRGGGAGLNFSVAGGTAQPAGKENLIWVNTPATVTAWVFDKKAPAAPSEGMVWFLIGLTSNAGFDAIKKNGIWVYPTACQQYVSGAWVTKTAKIYQAGAWVDWGYLYSQGVITELGNGIDTGYYFYAGTASFTAGTVTANPAYLTLDTTNTGNACGVACSPVNRIDLTGYSAFKAHINGMESISGSNTFRLVVGSVRSGTTVWNNKVAYAELPISEASDDVLVSCDISGLTGSYYTLVTLTHGGNPSGRAKVNVDRIYFE